ncbi:MAG: TolC family protein [Trueperaceae bacterium]|nr:TolC family protein [Trueperaceae bacterium]
MRRLLVFFALVLAVIVWAQEETQAPPPLTLEQAFTLALASDADLLSAHSDLESAQRDLRRVQADPLALRLDSLQAEQGVAAAEASLTSTEVATRLDLASAFTAALEADESLAIAKKQEAIASQTLEAQKIRFSAGAVTQIDVDKASNDYQAALRDSADAEASRSLAYAELSSLLGQPVASLEPISDELLNVPQLEDVQSRAKGQNAQLLAASRNVELLKTRLAAVDNAFSSRSEIEAARDNLESAQISYSESLRTLDLNIQNSYNSVSSAQARYESALANYSTALADLNAQKTRLDAGSISPLSYAQSELNFQTTASSLNSAKHAFYLSLLRLEQSIVGQ